MPASGISDVAALPGGLTSSARVRPSGEPGAKAHRTGSRISSPGMLMSYSRGTIRNTGNLGDTRPNSANGASLSTGRCALALGARFR